MHIKSEAEHTGLDQSTCDVHNNPTATVIISDVKFTNYNHTYSQNHGFRARLNKNIVLVSLFFFFSIVDVLASIEKSFMQALVTPQKMTKILK